MNKSAQFPHLSDEVISALNVTASADGIAVTDLLQQALERELNRREKRRKLIARHRRMTVFTPLEARTR